MTRYRGPARRPQGRAAVVTTSYPQAADDPSGHFVRTATRELASDGLDVVVIAPRPAGSRVSPEPDDPGIAVRWLSAGEAFGWPGALPRLRERPLRLFGAARFVRAARRELRALGSLDRYVAHFLVPSVWPIAEGEPLAAVEEAVLHGSDVRLVARLPGALRRRIAHTLRRFELTVTSDELRELVSSALSEEIARAAGVRAAPLDVTRDLSRTAARRELGIAPNAPLVCAVGRLVREKRTRVALRAARLVPGALTVVVGDGPERAALEREFPEVCFVGLVGRRRALTWIAAADALISASREEGAPSAVREARALGTPVVACPAGDLGVRAARDPGIVLA